MPSSEPPISVTCTVLYYKFAALSRASGWHDRGESSRGPLTSPFTLVDSAVIAVERDEGFPVSVTVVDRLLEESGMGYRMPQKIKTMTRHPDRNQAV
jgi:hypothetical protein